MERLNKRGQPSKSIEKWQDFLSFRKDITLDGSNKLTDQQLTIFWINKYQELIKDKDKLYYLFKSDLDQKNKNKAVQIATTKYKQTIQQQYQSLYLQNPKQLIIYKKIYQLQKYLSKYRLPKFYQKNKKQLDDIDQKIDKLIAKRNLAISYDQNYCQIDSITDQIIKYKEQNYNQIFLKFIQLLQKIIIDFKNQKKRQIILLRLTRYSLLQHIGDLCLKYQLYMKKRFTDISKNQKFIDIQIVKNDPNQFNDISSFHQEEEQHFQKQTQPQTTIGKPKSIKQCQLKNIINNQAYYQVTLPACGATNVIQYIVIKNKKNHQEKIKVNKDMATYEAKLTAYQVGYCQFSIYTQNCIGKSQEETKIRIWFNVDQELKGCQNQILYISGTSQDGLIPSNLVANQNMWYKSVRCVNASFGTQALVCDKGGVLAGWGRIYYHYIKTQEGQQTKEGEIEKNLQDAYGIKKFNCYTNVEAPSLFSQKDYIRVVSCGENYSLMCDQLGNAWSFGYNSSGQLGLGHTDPNVNTQNPIMINDLARHKAFIVNVKASKCGISLALDHEGYGYRWGLNQVEVSDFPILNTYGDIINYKFNKYHNFSQPTPIKIQKKHIYDQIQQLHIGQDFCMILTVKGQIYGWGQSKYLGLGTMKDAQFQQIYYICNPVPILKDVKSLSVGQTHTVITKRQGKIYGIGDSQYFKDKSQQFYREPTIIELPVKSHKIIECGPDYTAIYSNQEDKHNLSIISKEQILKQSCFSLPNQISKLICAKNTIGILVKQKK